MDCFDIKDGVLNKYSGVLENITIPDGVTAIADEAFHYGQSAEGSRNIKSVTLPESVRSIGFRAFCLCVNLEKINIPASVMEMGSRIFDQCESLKSITFPHSVKNRNGDFVINNGMFAGCKSLESFAIPNGTEIIGESSFGSCRNLQNITIPDSVTFIRERAFDSCAALTGIYIPKNAGIDNNVFSRCDNLKKIFYGGANMEEWDSLKRGNRPVQSKKTTIYFYSEKEPKENGGYWHFDDNGEIVVWRN